MKKTTKKTKTKKTPVFKVGGKATMLFHGFGLVSKEVKEVLAVNKDGSITLETDDDPARCKRFDAKTGACLNDTTDFGCYRTLKVK